MMMRRESVRRPTARNLTGILVAISILVAQPLIGLTSGVATAATNTETATYDFNSYTGGESLTGDNAWSFQGTGIYDSVQSCGVAPNCVKFDTNGDSASYDTSSGYIVKSLDFTMKRLGPNPTSMLQVEPFDQSGAQINSGFTFSTNGTHQGIQLPDMTAKIKFSILKTDGNIALDDVSVTIASTQDEAQQNTVTKVLSTSDMVTLRFDVAGEETACFDVRADDETTLPGNQQSICLSAGSHTIDFHNITHYIEVREMLLSGGYTEWQRFETLSVDTTAPVATIVRPSDNQHVRGIVPVVGQVEDENPMNSFFRISGPDGYVKTSLHSDGRSSHEFDWDTTGLKDGEYTISFEARDKARNKDGTTVHPGDSVKVITVTVDNTSPVVEGIEDGSTVNTPVSITVSGETAQSFGKLTVNGVEVEAIYDEVSMTYQYSFSEEGAYTIAAIDKAGNTTTVAFTIDTIAPRVEVIDYDDNLEGMPVLHGTVDDPNATVFVSINGVLYEAYVHTEEVDGEFITIWLVVFDEPLPPGAYTVVVRARDVVGNETAEGDWTRYNFTLFGTPITPVIPVEEYKPVAGPVLPSPSTDGTFPVVATQAESGESESNTVTTDDSAVLGAQTARDDSAALPAALPTAEGWKLFGVLWYWWLLIAAIIAGAWWVIIAAKRRQQGDA